MREAKMRPRKEKMRPRKWADLGEDCLIEIFKRVGMKPLAVDIPLVCKPWYKAAKLVDCWRCVYSLELSCIDCWIYCVASSQTVICRPRAKQLASMISKFKSLESLNWNCYKAIDPPIHKVLRKIIKHCKNFVNLHINSTYIGKKEVSAIARIPNLKCLRITYCFLDREVLKQIFSECKGLDELDISGCEGCCDGYYFEEDEEMMEMAPDLKSFTFDGATCVDDESYYLCSEDCDYYRPLNKNCDYDTSDDDGDEERQSAMWHLDLATYEERQSAMWHLDLINSSDDSEDDTRDDDGDEE